MNKSHHGFSLIELIITVAISGILFSVVGLIIVYANASWKKALDLTSMVDSYKYAKRKIEYQFRGATTDPSPGGSGPFTIRENSVDHSRSVRYITIDRSVNKFMVNLLTWDPVGKRIIHQHSDANASTTVGEVVTFGSLGVAELVMDKVESANFTSLLNPDAMQVSIKQSTTTANNETIISSNTFTVKRRSR